MERYVIQIRYYEQDGDGNDTVFFAVPDGVKLEQIENAVCDATEELQSRYGDDIGDYDTFDHVEEVLNEAAAALAGGWEYAPSYNMVLTFDSDMSVRASERTWY